MNLARMISDFNLVDARLTQSLTRDVAVDTRAALIRHAACLMDSIRRHRPDSPGDLHALIGFFLHRARRGRNRQDLAFALDLIAQHGGDGVTAAPCPSRSAHSDEVLDRLVARGIGQADLSAHIAPLSQRVSLVDREFRLICTSRGNQEFHAMRSDRFKGLHLADLVGTQRYNDGIRTHIETAMSGRPRAGYFPLDVPALGPRVMQCAMRPWFLPGGEVSGVLIRVNDVTDRLCRKHGFGDIPLAHPDHSIDGTT